MKRWTIATWWLWLAVVMNAVSGSLIALQLVNVVPSKGIPGWLEAYSLVAAIAQLICLGALLRWTRWGFWGLLAIGLATFAANIAHGTHFLLCLLGLAGVAFTFAILKGGGDEAIWPRLT
jgi:hypothetical protein